VATLTGMLSQGVRQGGYVPKGFEHRPECSAVEG
jgi:hypothetical protein